MNGDCLNSDSPSFCYGGDNLIYTVTLNPALDYVLKTNKLSFDDINRANDSSISFGGKGINVSVVLSRLSVPNTALGFVGGFTGAKLEGLLKKEGIKTDFVHTKGETRINVKIRCGSELDINAKGSDITDGEIEVLLKMLEKPKAGDYVVLAGSVPENLPSDIYEVIAEKLSSKGVEIVVDAEGDLLLNCLKFKPFLIKPNHHELGALFNTEINCDEDAVKYANKLKEMGAQNVLVSLAENGAVLVDEEKNIHKIKNAEGKLVNSVGCGDSMVAGFLSGYIRTGDYSEALKLATACANATAYSDGLASIEDIEALKNRVGEGFHALPLRRV